jgi:hypothetical protein
MIGQILVMQHLMNESSQAAPVVFFHGIRQRNIELEVVVLLFQLIKFVQVEQLPHTSSTVPVRDFAVAFHRLK